MKRIKVYPGLHGFYPNLRCLLPQNGFTFAFTPSIFVKYEDYWGVTIGLFWLFWQINLRFCIIDMDEVAELEKQLETERLEYKKQK